MNSNKQNILVNKIVQLQNQVTYPLDVISILLRIRIYSSSGHFGRFRFATAAALPFSSSSSSSSPSWRQALLPLAFVLFRAPFPFSFGSATDGAEFHFGIR